MRSLTKSFTMMSLTLAGVACLGCAQDVDQEDISSARENVAEEERETEMARNEVNQEINEKEREANALRHEVMKPNLEEAREAEQEANEARAEGQEKIREEEQETREAEQKLAETETRFEAQKARDAFIAEHKELLTTAERRMEELDTVAKSQEGTAKEATEQQISAIDTAHDTLAEELDDANTVDVLKWQTEKQDIQVAREALETALKTATPE